MQFIRLLAVLLTLLPFFAQAEGLQYVPKWHMQNGEACYGFEDAKKLLEIDLMLDNYGKQKRHAQMEAENFRLALLDTQEALRLSKIETEAWKIRSDEFEADYRKKVLELRESELKRHSNTPLYIIGGAVILVGGVLIGVSLR